MSTRLLSPIWFALMHIVFAWSPASIKNQPFVLLRANLVMNAFKRKNNHIENTPPYSKQLNKNRVPITGPKQYRERTVVILYHKPANVITSHSNKDEAPSSSSVRRRTVYEDIYAMNGYVGNRIINESHDTDSKRIFKEFTGIKSKLHAIGRLDADTTGALLLTNDGTLVHRITNPNSRDFGGSTVEKKPIQKTYEATIMGHHNLTNSTSNPLFTLLTEGVALSQKHGGQIRPVDNLEIISYPTRTTTCVSVTISEGKNRQIRRMFHAIGSGVMKLHRVSVGSVMLGDLKEGEWRLLSDDEVLTGLGFKCKYLDANTKFNGHGYSSRRESKIKHRKGDIRLLGHRGKRR